ncbi:MAG: pilin [Patescibacteria group bacterium]|jgi:hypothetical protein
MLKNILKRLLFFCYLFSVICFLAIPAQAVDQSSPYWGSFVAPNIQIAIPGVNISKDSVSCSGDYCDIPWIGEYVAGIYKYAIGVVGILAAIMLMVGGVRWLTAGGNASAVTDAQSYITGSLTGLVLALLSYTILYTINPALVSFKPIRVKMVENIPITSNTGGLSCNKINNESECSADKQELGYEFYKGASCPGADVSCKDTPDPTACYSGIMCCCARSAQTGCSWGSDATCGNNARQVSEYSKCGTNTGGMSTCCCDWAGGGDGKLASPQLTALINCIRGATSLGSYGGVSDKGDVAGNKQCCTSGDCKSIGCIHKCNSCHYGCDSGLNYQSNAVDWSISPSDVCAFMDQIDAKGCSHGMVLGYANTCNGKVRFQTNHGTHLHISTSQCNH